MKIYFVGSHSCGKTTMARHVARARNLPMISEVARQVQAELEVPLDRIRVDLELADRYQQRVFELQLEAETRHKSFVSDRAFDNVAYAAEHATITHRLVESRAFRMYMRRLRTEGLVFFLRPHLTLLHEDGMRAAVAWEAVIRIDGMIKLMLEIFDVPYLPIESSSMQERVRAVDFLLNRFDE